jgi:FAD/FMN-containing dehydrogenase
MTTELNSDPIETLRTTVRGPVLTAAEPGYDEARHVWNGMIDRRPPLIVRATGNADVIAAVNYARDNGLPVSVKGGGHSAAGTAVSDSALMIDLSLMDGVFVDPKARTARVQGGATWGLFDRECQVHGLATTGGVISTTGVGGLTLGGGFGWLLGKHGLAVDNLISCHVVLANGQLVTASESDNSDLFWALRGGSGNFGIVTSFEFRLHPVGPIVTGGLAAWPIDSAAGVLDFYSGYLDSTPDDLTAFFVQAGAPDGSGNFICAVIALHAGELEEGARLVQPIKDFGPPMLDALGPIPYTAHQSMLDAGFPAGNQVYWKGTFLRELSAGAMDVLVKQGAALPNPSCGLVLEHFHGVLNRVPNDATAFAQRTASFNVAIVAQWQDAAEADRCIAWARETFDALQPYSTGGVYLNYLGVGDDEGRVHDALGTNYDRLAAIKQQYDPGNLFSANQNIAPKR